MIPVTNPSRCHHSHPCRRGYQIRQSSSNLSLNAHTNPTFVLDEGVYPSGKMVNQFNENEISECISAPPVRNELPPSYDEVIRLPNQYPKPQSTLATPEGDNEHPPTIAEIEASEQSIATISSSSPALITNQQRNSRLRASIN